MLHEHSPEPVLLTPEEAAAILGRDVAELRRWRGRNVGPTFHDLGGGLIRYARESVLEGGDIAAVSDEHDCRNDLRKAGGTERPR